MILERFHKEVYGVEVSKLCANFLNSFRRFNSASTAFSWISDDSSSFVVLRVGSAPMRFSRSFGIATHNGRIDLMSSFISWIFFALHFNSFCWAVFSLCFLLSACSIFLVLNYSLVSAKNKTMLIFRKRKRFRLNTKNEAKIGVFTRRSNFVIFVSLMMVFTVGEYCRKVFTVIGGEAN